MGKIESKLSWETNQYPQRNGAGWEPFVERGEKGSVDDAAGTLAIVPAWRFLLDLELRHGV